MITATPEARAALIARINNTADQVEQWNEIAPPELRLDGLDFIANDDVPADPDWLPNGLSVEIDADGCVTSKLRDKVIEDKLNRGTDAEKKWALQAARRIFIAATLDRTDLTSDQRINNIHNPYNAQNWAQSQAWRAWWGYSWTQHPGGGITRGPSIPGTIAYASSQVDQITGAVTWQGAVATELDKYAELECRNWVQSQSGVGAATPGFKKLG